MHVCVLGCKHVRKQTEWAIHAISVHTPMPVCWQQQPAVSHLLMHLIMSNAAAQVSQLEVNLDVNETAACQTPVQMAQPSSFSYTALWLHAFC